MTAQPARRPDLHGFGMPYAANISVGSALADCRARSHLDRASLRIDCIGDAGDTPRTSRRIGAAYIDALAGTHQPIELQDVGRDQTLLN